jgi:hypothetical protein
MQRPIIEKLLRFASRIRMRHPLLIVATSLAVIAVAGFAEGRFSNKESSERELARAVEAVSRIPLNCGQWTATELDLAPDELRVAEASGAMLRRYTHSTSGRSVIVLLLCGPAGPISVHPPTACYRARGYRLVDAPERGSLIENSREHSFLTAEFTNPAGFADDRVGIMWSWSANGSWAAPENPRLEFAGQPVLFKLYVTWDRCRDSSSLIDSRPTDFCQEFVESLKEVLFP